MHKVGGGVGDTETEKVVHLSGENSQRNTCRKAHNDRVGNELDDVSQFEQAHNNEQYARHNHGDKQTCQTVLLNDTVDDDNECARRSANLHFAPAESRDDKARNDGGNKPLGRSYTRRDTERNRQRNSHHAHDDTGNRILQKTLHGVAAHSRKEFGTEHVLEREKVLHRNTMQG